MDDSRKIFIVGKTFFGKNLLIAMIILTGVVGIAFLGYRTHIKNKRLEKNLAPWTDSGQIFDYQGIQLTNIVDGNEVYLLESAFYRLPIEQQTSIDTYLSFWFGTLHHEHAHVVASGGGKAKRKLGRVDNAMELGFNLWFSALSAEEKNLFVFERKPRFGYPYKDMMASVLGIVGSNGDGQEGIFFTHKKHMSGKKNVYLTLDIALQKKIQAALVRNFEANNAPSATIVLLDLEQQQVRALIDLPSFDPNDRFNLPNALRPKTVSDQLQLGPMILPFYWDAYIHQAGHVKQALATDFISGEASLGKKLLDELGAKTLFDIANAAGFARKVNSGLPFESPLHVQKLTEARESSNDLAAGYGIATNWLSYSVGVAYQITGTMPHDWPVARQETGVQDNDA